MTSTPAPLAIAPHPLLDLQILRVHLPVPLAGLPAPPGLQALLHATAPAALQAWPDRPDEAVTKAVRDLLRHGGYKPTGRGKPASEYLARAAVEGGIGSINAAVDAGNAVSLHTGLPISVVDAGRLQGPLEVRLGGAGERYVFNAAGHDIDVEGLLCLGDAVGPCANAVKDAQRTKTSESTEDLLVLIWGTRALPGRAGRAAAWLGALYRGLGAELGHDTR